MIKSKMYDEKLIVSLHEEAKKVTKELQQKEWDLILVLQQVIKYEVYRKYKYPSLFKYLTLSLGLSESRAQDFSAVAHSSLRFEKLQTALESGKLSISKARRITPVLNAENQEEWIDKAKLNSHRSLERLVASKNPEAAFFDSVRYISETQVEVKMIMTIKEFEECKRSQDLQCQKQKKPVSMKNAYVRASRDYLEKHDPVIKARRHQERALKKSINTTKGSGTCQKNQVAGSKWTRQTLPAQILHQVNLRDKRRCEELLPNGQKCQESRWIDIHHIKPVSHGGDNSLQNLVTLCKGHHQLEHWI